MTATRVTPRPAQRLQQMDGPHHIRCEGRQRITVACAHERLGRQMEDDFGLRGPDQIGKS